MFTISPWHAQSDCTRDRCKLDDGSPHAQAKHRPEKQVWMEHHGSFLCRYGPRPTVSRSNRGNSANVALFSIGTDSAKELLYSRLKIEEVGPGYCHFPISPDYDSEYFDQLTAEKAVTKAKVGVKTRARNEALDIRVYSLAAFVNLNANLDALAKQLKARIIDESRSTEPQKKNY